MVQSLNTKALLSVWTLLRRPSLTVPHLAVENISMVNYTKLKEECGISSIIYDKDNTLTAPYASQLHPDARKGLQQAIQVFGRENVAILSNSAGTNDDPGFKDAEEIEHILGIAVIRHSEKKPGGLREVLQHFDTQDPAKLCMIGDRILTDIVFGNLHGMLTVHTLPLAKTTEDNARDNWTAKLLRPVENKVMYGDWWGGRKLRASQIPHKYWKGAVECPLALTETKHEDDARTE